MDEFGEEDVNLRRGKPLKLEGGRVEDLETMWRRGEVPREVANRRQRRDGDNGYIIRAGYY